MSNTFAYPIVEESVQPANSPAGQFHDLIVAAVILPAKKLPYAEHVFIPDAKITHYLLNLTHSKGRSKAKFFHGHGFTLADWSANWRQRCGSTRSMAKWWIPLCLKVRYPMLWRVICGLLMAAHPMCVRCGLLTPARGRHD